MSRDQFFCTRVLEALRVSVDENDVHFRMAVIQPVLRIWGPLVDCPDSGVLIVEEKKGPCWLRRLLQTFIVQFLIGIVRMITG